MKDIIGYLKVTRVNGVGAVYFSNVEEQPLGKDVAAVVCMDSEGKLSLEETRSIFEVVRSLS